MGTNNNTVNVCDRVAVVVVAAPPSCLRYARCITFWIIISRGRPQVFFAPVSARVKEGKKKKEKRRKKKSVEPETRTKSKNEKEKSHHPFIQPISHAFNIRFRYSGFFPPSSPTFATLFAILSRLYHYYRDELDVLHKLYLRIHRYTGPTVLHCFIRVKRTYRYTPILTSRVRKKIIIPTKK